MASKARQHTVFELFESWRRHEAELAAITGLLGIRPVEIDDGTASLSMEVGPPHHNPFGAVAGGMFSALADVAMGVALATTLDGEGFSTVQQQIQHLRSTAGSRLIARAQVVHRGRRVAHLRGSIVDAENRLLAEASAVWLIHPIEAAEHPAGNASEART